MANKMVISSSLRLKPFSHQPGVSVVLPKSTLCFQIYPCLVLIKDLSLPKQSFTPLQISSGGFVENFIVQQDLERCCLKVWGNSPNGYFRYRIQASPANSYTFTWERKPEAIDVQGISPTPSTDDPQNEIPAHLSFGVSKIQDWTLIQRRLSIEEFLPLWYRLGQLTPKSSPTCYGNAALLEKGNDAIDQRHSAELAQVFKELFCTGFEGLLAPTLLNLWHLGSPHDYENADLANPLYLLHEGANLIRRMLVDQMESEIHILPCCPKELHCGRLIGLSLPNGNYLDIEWSKKTIRRLIFTAGQDGTYLFKFKDVNQFRLRHNLLAKEVILPTNQPLDVCAGERYYLDNFQH